MLILLDPRPGDRVLDVGSGSGWTTALLAHLVGPEGSVVGVERIPELIVASRAGLADRYPTAELHLAEPRVLGWPERAPYDRVLASALLEQLAVGGVLVLPVRGVMHRIVLTPEGPTDERHGRYAFVPLIED